MAAQDCGLHRIPGELPVVEDPEIEQTGLGRSGDVLPEPLGDEVAADLPAGTGAGRQVAHGGVRCLRKVARHDPVSPVRLQRDSLLHPLLHRGSSSPGPLRHHREDGGLLLDLRLPLAPGD